MNEQIVQQELLVRCTFKLICSLESDISTKREFLSGIMTLGGADVTTSPGSSSPSNGKNFVPDILPISAGTTVTWTNGYTTLHTVTSGTPEGGNSGNEFDSSYIASVTTFQHLFNTPGTFDYYCTLHPFMKGKVIVS